MWIEFSVFFFHSTNRYQRHFVLAGFIVVITNIWHLLFFRCRRVFATRKIVCFSYFNALSEAKREWEKRKREKDKNLCKSFFNLLSRCEKKSAFLASDLVEGSKTRGVKRTEMNGSFQSFFPKTTTKTTIASKGISWLIGVKIISTQLSDLICHRFSRKANKPARRQQKGTRKVVEGASKRREERIY